MISNSELSLEAFAAEHEARQAIRDMWKYGFPRCPLTRYAESVGKLADEMAKQNS
ncbi:hypothetical protein [Kitasatospora sp. NPDC001095]